MYIGCRNHNLNTVTTQQLALFCVVFSTLTSIQVNQQPVTDYLRTSGLSLSLSVYFVLSIAPDLSIWIKYLFNVPFGLREREGEQSRFSTKLGYFQPTLLYSPPLPLLPPSIQTCHKRSVPYFIQLVEDATSFTITDQWLVALARFLLFYIIFNFSVKVTKLVQKTQGCLGG